MKKLPTDDDESLVNFLKANRPEVPSVTPDLEENILQAVELEVRLPGKNSFLHDPAKCKRLWLVPPAIAIGVIFSIGSDSLRSSGFLAPISVTNSPTKSELVGLEVFLEHNWNSLTIDSASQINFHNNADIEWMQLANSNQKKLTQRVAQKTIRR